MSVPSPEPPAPTTWNVSDSDAHEDAAPLDGFNRTNAMIDPFDRAASELAVARALRFRVLRPLAKGGLGEVFVARDEELRREVALKLIQEQFADDTDSRDRFLFEAEITGRLEHPGVIPVYGLGVDGKGRPYYAMRFIRGESLKESIARFHRADGPTREPGERSLALRELLGRFINVCNTIAYAHGRGVLHRDLKPANVMLGDFGETLVVDWGLAKIAGRPDGEPHAEDGTQNPEPRSGTNSTKQGSWLGTPSFMSPEQAAGRIDLLGPASDVYSLGATLYNLLTGKSAFDGTDVTTVLSQVQEGTFPSPRSLEPRIDPALEAVCLKAMANKPENRYASCRALADDVERLGGRRAGLGLARAVRPPVASLGQAESDDGDGRGGCAARIGRRPGGRLDRSDSGQGRAVALARPRDQREHGPRRGELGTGALQGRGPGPL